MYMGFKSSTQLQLPTFSKFLLRKEANLFPLPVHPDMALARNWKRQIRHYRKRTGQRPYRNGKSKYGARSSHGSFRKPSIMKINMANVAPDSVLVKLRYPQIITHNGSITDFTAFRGNGAFDPDATGSGQQPGGYDQWAGLYGNYRVLASQIEISIVNEGTVATTVTVFPTLSNVTPSTYQNATVVPYKRQIVMSGQSGMGVAFLKSYMTTSKIVGLSSMAINAEDDFQATTASLPANQWYWGVFSTTLDGSTNGNIIFTVNVTYYMRFEDRIQVAIS